jgi:hypothetical protein
MIAILVLGTFIVSIVVERYKEASKYNLQTAPSAEVEARRAQPIVAGYEVHRHVRLHQVRAEIDRRPA